MSHKNTVKARRAKENSAILQETQSQCTVGRRSLLLWILVKRENIAVVIRIKSKYFYTWLYHAICYIFKKTKTIFQQLNSKNNGPVLFSETIFRHWNCSLSSFTNGWQGRIWIKTWKIGPTFSRFNATHVKSPKKIVMVIAPWWKFFYNFHFFYLYFTPF